jgi:hypothetical protein
VLVGCIAHQWGLQLIFRNGDTPHPTFEKLEYPYVVKKKIGYEKTIMMMYRLNICYMYFNSFLDRQFRGDMA